MANGNDLTNHVAWWRFDESGTLVAVDSTGNHDGMLLGADRIPGLVGNALEFNGTSHTVTVPDSDEWTLGTQDFTISFWANFDVAPGGTTGRPGDVFISHNEGAGTQNKWFFSAWSGNLGFHVNGPGIGSSFFATTPFTPTPGEWYHLAITREGDTFRTYIDGELGTEVSLSINIPDVSAPLTIGASNEAFGGFFDGTLDEFRIHDVALSQAEIMQIVADEGEGGGGDPEPDVSLSLGISSGLAAGEIGTAQVGITVNPPSIPAPAYIVAISADGGLVEDGFSGAFSDSTYALARDFTIGKQGTLLMPVVGTAGPRSLLQVTAQLADNSALSDIAARIASLQPAFIETSVVSRIEANLGSQFGQTIGTLANALVSYAEQFETFELDATSATAALAFAIEAAGDYGSLEERGKLGSLGQGWSTLADMSLAIDGTSVQLRGLTGIDALRALSIDASALYTVSNSAGRSVVLSGDVIALSAPSRPAFELGSDGQFRTIGAFEGSLARTDSGFTVELTDGDALLFDAAGNFLRMDMTDGRQIVASHNPEIQITGLAGPNGSSLTFNRAADGKVEDIEDADGRTASFSYDGDGRLQSVTRLEGQSLFEYDANGDLAKSTAPGGIIGEFAYDGFGRLDAASYGGGAQTEDFAYDNDGGLTITDGAGRSVQVDLLPGGFAGRITNDLGEAYEILFDETGNVSGVRAADGAETSFEFDDQGRLSKIVDANGAELGFGYDDTSQEPSSFTDAGGNTRNFDYDTGGRITEATWADGTTLQFDYDDQGNLTEYTNRRGDDVIYTYDARGRLLSGSDSSAGPTTYTYDASGRLTSATNDRGTTSLVYDNAERVTQIDYPTGKSLSYTYDDAGLRTSMSDGGDYNVFYDYDALGRLTGLRDEDSQIVAYEYDGAGNLIREDNGNGTVSLFSHDEVGRLTRIENRAPDGSVNSFNAYTYDTAGQRVANETQDGTWTYGYDAIGQLTSAEFVSINAAIADKSLIYNYDAAGDRTRVVEDGVETLYTANALNQYTQVGDATFTYDADGNMTSRTDGEGMTSYTYDLDNRLTSVTEADGSVLTFDYDVFGNRVAKTVNGVETEYLVDPFGLGDVVSEFTGGTLSATYTHGLGLAAGEIGEQDAYYDVDAVGTVTTLTGTTGDIQNRYAFTPFGTELFEIEALVNDFEFNGEFGVAEDSDDLTFMRARNYSDDLGRFLSEDPLWLEGDVENLYKFSLNNPVELSDPEGEYAQIIFFGARAVVNAYSLYNAYRSYKRLDKALQEGDAGTASIVAAEVAVGLLGGKLLTRLGSSLVGDTAYEFAIKKPLLEKGYGALSTGLFKEWLDELFGDSADDRDQMDPAGGSGPSNGDPHMTTFDGLGYSFQAVGEFVLFRATDGSSEVQVRQEPWGNSTVASVNTAVTARLGDRSVGVYVDRAIPLVIDGTAVSLTEGQSIAVGTGSVYFDGVGYTVTDEFGNGVWAGLSGRGFINLRAFIHEDFRGEVEGTLGDADGDRANDFALPDGTVIGQPVPVTQLYGPFTEEWRIAQEESLFDYADGESTETFTDRSFPTNVVRLENFDPAVRAAAEAVAIAAGLTPGTFEFETTVLDIAITGLPDFAEVLADAPEFQPEGAEVEVIPAELNEAPTANPDAVEVSEDGTITIDVLASASDPEGDPITLLSGSDPNGGTVEVVEQKLVFTPPPNFFGETTLTFLIRDAAGNEVEATAIVNVMPVNDPPVADAESFEVSEDGTLTVAAATLLDGDTDTDGDTLAIPSVSNAVNGTVTLDDKGNADASDDEVIFTPTPGYSGPASFDYTVADGFGGEDTVTVDVTVTEAPNVPPSASLIDAGAVAEDAGVVSIDLLGDAGASDSDGGTLGVANVSVTDQDGAAVVFGLTAAALTIDPTQFAEALASGESAVLKVAYEVTDGQGGETPNTGQLVVDGLDGPFTWYLDGDADGYGIDDAATNLTAYAAPAGTSDVAGDADDADAAVYPGAPEINDGKDNDQDGGIDEDNTAPVADAESFEVAEDGTLTVAAATLLEGDTDADDDALTVTSVSAPVNGAVSLDDKGDGNASNDEVIFTPTPGYSGAASFDYTVNDGFGGADTVTVAVNVTEQIPSPTNSGSPFAIKQSTNGGANRFWFDGDEFLISGQGVRGRPSFQDVDSFMIVAADVFGGDMRSRGEIDDVALALGARPDIEISPTNEVEFDGYRVAFGSENHARNFGDFVETFFELVDHNDAVALDPTDFQFDIGGVTVFFDETIGLFGLTDNGGATVQNFDDLETFVEAIVGLLGGDQTRDGRFNEERIANGQIPNQVRVTGSDDLIVSGRSVAGQFRWSFDDRDEALVAETGLERLFESIAEASIVAGEFEIA